MGWIGVDFDGTLATYESGNYKHGECGEPIPAMVERVKAWIAKGQEVRIFTARVSHDDTGEAKRAIQDWCEKYLGRRLAVTNQKDYAMMELWDDRAVQVEMNTGRPVGYSTRGNTPAEARVIGYCRCDKCRGVGLKKEEKQ